MTGKAGWKYSPTRGVLRDIDEVATIFRNAGWGRAGRSDAIKFALHLVLRPAGSTAPAAVVAPAAAVAAEPDAEKTVAIPLHGERGAGRSMIGLVDARQEAMASRADSQKPAEAPAVPAGPMAAVPVQDAPGEPVSPRYCHAPGVTLDDLMGVPPAH